MTVVDRPAPRRAAGSTARQARIRLASEGVVASYIHDISTPRAPRRRTFEDPFRPVARVRYRLTENAKRSADAKQSGHRP